jgi:hypothetical protein
MIWRALSVAESHVSAVEAVRATRHLECHANAKDAAAGLHEGLRVAFAHLRFSRPAEAVGTRCSRPHASCCSRHAEVCRGESTSDGGNCFSRASACHSVYLTAQSWGSLVKSLGQTRPNHSLGSLLAYLPEVYITRKLPLYMKSLRLAPPTPGIGGGLASYLLGVISKHARLYHSAEHPGTPSPSILKVVQQTMGDTAALFPALPVHLPTRPSRVAGCAQDCIDPEAVPPYYDT